MKLPQKNILTGLQEARGDHLEDIFSNCSLRYAAYKQFIWWVLKQLGEGNRRVIPSFALWKIREHFPSLMQIMLIILKIIKTKSTNVSRVKCIVYIIAKTIKQTKVKMFFI